MQQHGLTMIEEKKAQIKDPEIHGQIRKIFGEESAIEFAIAAKVAIEKTPKLANCTKESFLAAYIECAQMGLLPNTPAGEAYLIPFGNVCTLVVGFKGLIMLAYRSGLVSHVECEMLRENDKRNFARGDGQRFLFQKAESNRGERLGAWCRIVLKSGGDVFKYMDEEEILSHRPAKRYKSPWDSKNVYDQDAMWVKTAIIQAMKIAPKSKEMQNAVATEERFERGVVAKMETVNSAVDYEETSQQSLGFADAMPAPVQAESEVIQPAPLPAPEPVADSGPPEKTEEWKAHFLASATWLAKGDALSIAELKAFDKTWKADGWEDLAASLNTSVEKLLAERLS